MFQHTVSASTFSCFDRVDQGGYGPPQGQIARPSSRYGRPVSPGYTEAYGAELLEPDTDMYGRPVSRMRSSYENHYGYR